MSSAADTVIGLYRRHAAAWTDARAAQAVVEKTWLERFCALLEPGAEVLDIGCGAGEPVARFIMARGHGVFGVDSAPEMLRLFRGNFPAAPVAQADMRQLRLGRLFGGLIAWDSFFHLAHEHQRAMFPIFRDHAVARAPLLFTTGPAHGEAIGILEGEDLYHASLDPAEYRRLLDENGFDAVAHIAEDPACSRHTVWLAQRR
jgi:SAM-dependent methyltransferase